jgi:hypothetical protein
MCTPRVFKAKNCMLRKVVFKARDVSRIESVQLKFNELTVAGVRAMFGQQKVASGLRHMDFSENGINRFYMVMFSQMRHLKKLIMYNYLEARRVSLTPFMMYSDCFDCLSHLEELELSVDHLERVQKGVFKNLSKLNSLELKSHVVHGKNCFVFFFLPQFCY